MNKEHYQYSQAQKDTDNVLYSFFSVGNRTIYNSPKTTFIMREQTPIVPELYDEARLKAIFESPFLQKKLQEAKSYYTKISNKITILFEKNTEKCNL